MKPRVLFALVLVATLAFGLVGTALAQDEGAPDMETLSPEETLTGTLNGSSAGSFAYYRIPYPGNNTDVTIRVVFSPSDPTTVSGLGFNVYGPNAFALAAGANQEAAGVFEATNQEWEPGPWLVQVYNYLPGRTVTYEISVTGLPETAQATIGTAMTAAPATATQAAMAVATATPTDSDGTHVAMATTTPAGPGDTQTLQGNANLSGTLEGSRAGSFDYYRLAYPGGDDEVTIRATFSPSDQQAMAQVGINVYNDNGRLVASSEPREAPGVAEATTFAWEEGIWTIQVYSYLEGRPVSYDLTISGLSTAQAMATPMTTPAPAQTPAATRVAAATDDDHAMAENDDMVLDAEETVSGQLTGSRAGTFAVYEFSYPGNDEDMMLTLQFWPSDPSINDRIGLNVYAPNGRRVASATGGTAPGRKVVTVSSDVAGIYRAQIYNYNQDVTVNYDLIREVE